LYAQKWPMVHNLIRAGLSGVNGCELYRGLFSGRNRETNLSSFSDSGGKESRQKLSRTRKASKKASVVNARKQESATGPISATAKGTSSRL
jgi:hypothetical protein